MRLSIENFFVTCIMHAYSGQGFMVNNHHPTEGGARGRSRVVIVNNKSHTNLRYDAPTELVLVVIGKLTRYIGMLLANME